MNINTSHRLWRYCIFSLIAIACFVLPVLAKEPVKIQVTGYLTEHADEKIIEAFEKKYPDIDVEFIYLSDMSKLQVMLTSGDAPDVVAVDAGQIYAFIAANLVKDLQPFIQRDQFPLSDILPGFLTPMVKNGHVYGLPYAPGRYANFFNGALFEKSGIKKPGKGWTLDEFETAASKLTRDTNGDGNPDVFGTNLTTNDRIGGWFSSWQVPPLFGARFVSQDGTRVTLDSPKFVEAVEWALRFSREKRASAWDWGKSGDWGGDDFQNGRLGMVWQLSGDDFFRTRLHEKFEWNISHLPIGPGGPRGIVYTSMYGIPVNAKHPEAAWKFLSFAFSNEAQEIVGRLLPYVSTREAMLSIYGHHPIYPDFNPEPMLNPYPSDPFLMTQMPYYGQLHGTYLDGFTKIFTGKVDPQSGLKELNRQLQAKLDGLMKP